MIHKLIIDLGFLNKGGGRGGGGVFFLFFSLFRVDEIIRKGACCMHICTYGTVQVGNLGGYHKLRRV